MFKPLVSSTKFRQCLVEYASRYLTRDERVPNVSPHILVDGRVPNVSPHLLVDGQVPNVSRWMGEHCWIHWGNHWQHHGTGGGNSGHGGAGFREISDGECNNGRHLRKGLSFEILDTPSVPRY